MFDTLTEKLGTIFKGLSGQGVLTEKTVNAALHDIRLALIEADVGLDVVKDFIATIRKRAIGQDVQASIAPGQQIMQIVFEALVQLLGGDDKNTGLRIDSPPAIIMMAGLQGVGKTTSVGKLAKRIATERKSSVLVASLDVRRPAAMEQLSVLAQQVGVACLPVVQGQDPVAIAKRAVSAAHLAGHETVLLDTAGRTTLDEPMMIEAASIAKAVNPSEILLVADALSGQDAVQTARNFAKRLTLTGLLLTRMDGDSHGGAALSMRAETGVPVKFVGTGEGMEDLEAFDPQRMAGRILGQGDLAGLLEKVAKASSQTHAKDSAARLKKGQFGLQEFADQLQTLGKMGGFQALAGLVPGMGKKIRAANALMDDGQIRLQLAAISSMTPAERNKPALLNASRKRRISKGSGVEVSQINRMLKMHRNMADMVKKVGMKGMMGLGKQLASEDAGDLSKNMSMDPQIMAMLKKQGR